MMTRDVADGMSAWPRWYVSAAVPNRSSSNDVSGEDEGEALERTLLLACGAFLFSFAFYNAARHHKGLLRRVFAPCAPASTSGAVAYQGCFGVVHEAMASLQAVKCLSNGLGQRWSVALCC